MLRQKYDIRARNTSEYPDTNDNAAIIDKIDGVDPVQSARFIADFDDGLEQQLVHADHLHRIINDL